MPAHVQSPPRQTPNVFSTLPSTLEARPSTQPLQHPPSAPSSLRNLAIVHPRFAYRHQSWTSVCHSIDICFSLHRTLTPSTTPLFGLPPIHYDKPATLPYTHTRVTNESSGPKAYCGGSIVLYTISTEDATCRTPTSSVERSTP